MSHNITVEGGTSVRLPTAGKYCDRDIIITAEGGAEDLDTELTEQEALVEELKSVLRGKASGGVEKVVLQSKTITPSKSSQEVTADEGYTALEKVTVEAIPSEYIVPSGTLEVTENGTHDVTAYASVNVNVEASGGDNESVLVGIIERTTVDFSNKSITKIGANAFRGCTTLKSVNIPNATLIMPNAFSDCTEITTARFPSVTIVYGYAFYNCFKLADIDLTSVTRILGRVFDSCRALKKIDLPNIKTIDDYAFSSARELETVVIRSDTVCVLGGANAFAGTLIASGTGYIYVPRTLADGTSGVATYQGASNWSTYASQFRAIEDYPEICGGEG